MRALITGLAGPELGAAEAEFLRRVRPCGIILFSRNLVSLEQIAALVADAKNAIGHDDVLVLIDQEGGRVQRLRPPLGRALPPARAYADLYAADPETACAAARSQARLVAADLAALVSHLKLTDYRIVAQSMGGWTTVEYALTNPIGLRAIVLAGTTGTINPQQIAEPERTRIVSWLQTEFTKMPNLFARGIHPAGGERMAREQPAQHLLYRHIDDQNAALDKGTLGGKLMAARTRPPEDLNKITCPILFISGDEDIVIPPFAADALARATPGAKVAHIPDAGHSAYFERPARFNQIVDEFLKDIK